MAVTITIEIPDHQMLTLGTMCKVLHNIAHVLEDAETRLTPWDSQKYQQEEAHLLLSSVGDIVWSIKR